MSRADKLKSLTSKVAHGVLFYILWRHVVVALYRHVKARGLLGSLREVYAGGEQVSSCHLSLCFHCPESRNVLTAR